MDNRPIGVFDSGLGGLTGVRELARLLPGEDLLYFGDTARTPYGSRSRDTIIRYGQQDVAFLLSRGVKAILCACNTVSSTLPADYTAGLPVPFIGVVDASAAAAARATKNGRIGVIATAATVKSGSYTRALNALDAPQLPLSVTVRACPLFVPVIENGYVGRGEPIVTALAREYLAPLKEAGVDTLILGCTHYPLIADAIADEMGPGVTLIDSGAQGALALRDALAGAGRLRGRTSGGEVQFYVSDSGENFAEVGGLFLGKDLSGAVHPFTLAAP